MVTTNPTSIRMACCARACQSDPTSKCGKRDYPILLTQAALSGAYPGPSLVFSFIYYLNRSYCCRVHMTRLCTTLGAKCLGTATQVPVLPDFFLRILRQSLS